MIFNNIINSFAIRNYLINKNYMQKINLSVVKILMLLSLAFTAFSCTKEPDPQKPDPETPEVKELSFSEIKVSDILPSSATISITPDAEDIKYFWKVIKTSEISDLTDELALDFLAKEITEDKLVSGKLNKVLEPGSLVEETEYVVCAFGWDMASAKAQGKLQKSAVFKTTKTVIDYKMTINVKGTNYLPPTPEEVEDGEPGTSSLIMDVTAFPENVIYYISGVKAESFEVLPEENIIELFLGTLNQLASAGSLEYLTRKGNLTNFEDKYYQTNTEYVACGFFIEVVTENGKKQGKALSKLFHSNKFRTAPADDEPEATDFTTVEATNVLYTNANVHILPTNLEADYYWGIVTEQEWYDMTNTEIIEKLTATIDDQKIAKGELNYQLPENSLEENASYRVVAFGWDKNEGEALTAPSFSKTFKTLKQASGDPLTLEMTYKGTGYDPDEEDYGTGEMGMSHLTFDFVPSDKEVYYYVEGVKAEYYEEDGKEKTLEYFISGLEKSIDYIDYLLYQGDKMDKQVKFLKKDTEYYTCGFFLEVVEVDGVKTINPLSELFVSDKHRTAKE